MASDTVSTLNSLIETLNDGKDGFRNAASNLLDTQIKATFERFAQQRDQLAHELQSEVQRLGGKPESKGSVSASAHRGWMDLKGAFGAGDKSILNEAERGEDVAVKAYEDALKSKLSPEVLTIVQRQYGEVKQAHDTVKRLRDSWK